MTTIPGAPVRRPTFAWRRTALVAVCVVVLLVSVAGRYGYHCDELYFRILGNHPAWGYPDQPPLTPLLARAVAQARGDRLEVIAMQPLLLGPLAAPIVAAGIVALLRWPGLRPARAVAVGYGVICLLLLAADGQCYYTCGLLMTLYAVGCVAVYRVIQESLTNVRNHAGAVHAEATVVMDDSEIRVRVTNLPGNRPERTDPDPTLRRSSARAGAGTGLMGMRERVTLLGGCLAAEPTAAGGFEVRARIPLPAPTASRSPE